MSRYERRSSRLWTRYLVTALRLSAGAMPVLALGGCAYSFDDNVDLSPTPHEDQPYRQALHRATKQATVINNFETDYTVAATYLSPEFRAALSKRYTQLYGEPQPILEEATSKAAFFVSLFSPDDQATRLAESEIWTITLNVGNEALKPILIRRLADKQRWAPFFESVNHWTADYLVVFDSPSRTPNSPEFVGKTSLGLSLANADAQVKLKW